MNWRTMVFILAGFLMLVGDSFAQSPTTTAQKAADPTFDELFKEWKSLLSRMRQLQEEFQIANAGAKASIVAEFSRLRAQGQLMAPKLIAAAEQRYVANPAKEGAAGDLLMANAQDSLRSENYEEAFRLSKLLIDHQYPDKAVNTYAGYAAYVINNIESARKYLTLAKEAGKLDVLPPPEKDLPPLAEGALGTLDHLTRLWEVEAKLRAAEAKADDLPRVKLETSKGTIVLELFENEAPNTVTNFVSLVEKGFYNGVIFHRVIPGFMAQGGDPQGDGMGGPGYTIPDEVDAEKFPNRRQHFRGSLSMAKTAAPDSGGSQFFLCFVPTFHLNNKHTVFGRVTEGIDVLAKLQRTEKVSQVGETDKILKATVLRKRNHEYVPKKSSE